MSWTQFIYGPLEIVTLFLAKLLNKVEETKIIIDVKAGVGTTRKEANTGKEKTSLLHFRQMEFSGLVGSGLHSRRNCIKRDSYVMLWVIVFCQNPIPVTTIVRVSSS